LQRILLDSYAEDLEGSGLEQQCQLCYHMVKATVYGQRKDRDMERLAFDSMLAALEQLEPEDYRPRAIMLGMAYAGRGLKTEAIRVAEAAVAREREADEVERYARYSLPLAEIYTTTGEYEAAIDRLEYLLSIPYRVSVPLLKLDPHWDPLRDHPRFQALLADYE
jgi:tetratricopeptide (TPR) repeat protein